MDEELDFETELSIINNDIKKVKNSKEIGKSKKTSYHNDRENDFFNIEFVENERMKQIISGINNEDAHHDIFLKNSKGGTLFDYKKLLTKISNNITLLKNSTDLGTNMEMNKNSRTEKLLEDKNNDLIVSEKTRQIKEYKNIREKVRLGSMLGLVFGLTVMILKLFILKKKSLLEEVLEIEKKNKKKENDDVLLDTTV
tara:strand:+ start:46 stop:639 length:594 start_codon:yes stop_codon:yes gene_type:complete